MPCKPEIFTISGPYQIQIRSFPSFLVRAQGTEVAAGLSAGKQRRLHVLDKGQPEHSRPAASALDNSICLNIQNSPQFSCTQHVQQQLEYSIVDSRLAVLAIRKTIQLR
jgi:hypothetical protein